jgi:glyoxylate reductase
MPKPRVLVTRPIPDAGLQMLRETCDVRLLEYELPPPHEVLLQEIADVDGLLCLLTEKIDAEIINAGQHLKVISNFAVGYDNIDVAAATARGIPIGNTPGVLTNTTADLAFALLMAAARRIGEAERYVHAGKWKTWGPLLLLGADVYGATLGIVGFGRIGQAMAQRAKGFDMNILYHSRRPHDDAAREYGADYRDLETLLAESDFVSLHLPLTPETHHLIGEHELEMMKPTGILINTSRGGVIDPTALYHALQSGEIGYAALDVTEPEPIQMDDPLLNLDNCLIVPHIGSASVSARNKMATMSAANLLAGIKGEHLPNCVNPSVYD